MDGLQEGMDLRPTSQAWLNGDHDLPSYDSELSDNDNPVATTDSRFTGYRREKRTNFNGSLTLAYDIPRCERLTG
mgnify:CR=1 FL=1